MLIFAIARNEIKPKKAKELYGKKDKKLAAKTIPVL